MPNPINQNGNGRRVVQLNHHQQKIIIGPIPPAEELEKYKRVVADAPERILAMAERQSSHRQSMEMKALNGKIWEGRLGLVAGIVVVSGCIIASIFLALNNKTTVACVIGGSTVVGLAGVFITGKIFDKQNKSQ